MPAKWGSGKSSLPAGRYLAAVANVAMTQGSDYNDKTQKVDQFKWEIQYQKPDQTWSSHTIWTGCGFMDASTISNPQFVPKLMRLVRACGLPLPQNAAEVATWKEDSLIGRRFILDVAPDEETGVLQTRFLSVQLQAPTPAAPAPIPASQAPPPAPQQATPDPFDGDPGAGAVAQPNVPRNAPRQQSQAPVAGPLDGWV